MTLNLSNIRGGYPYEQHHDTRERIPAGRCNGPDCHDSLIPVSDISFDNLDTIKIAGSTHPLKPIAQRSIAWRLGIPYNYLRKCPPEIQSVQMNYWIEHEKNEQLFARFDGNSVRAIFTPKYKPVDNMDVILEIYGMGYRPETQVQCHLDEEFMSL